MIEFSARVELIKCYRWPMVVLGLSVREIEHGQSNL
jgi:hypothetical protein